MVASSRAGGQNDDSALAWVLVFMHLAEQDEAAQLATVDPVRPAEQRER